MTSPLRILLLEDSARDAELIQELLEGDHFVCDMTHVQTRVEFLAALEDGGIDLILADYTLPSFDGLSALKLALRARPDLPFIFVSGSLGEEIAIEALKIGATDYVLKTRLSRLVPSVQRALREAQERAERKKAEEALHRSEAFLAEGQRISHTGSWGWSISTGRVVWSEEHYRIFGFDPKGTEATFQLFWDRIHSEDRALVQKTLDTAIGDGSGFNLEFRIVLPDGSSRYLHGAGRPVSNAAGDIADYIGTTMDITERKRSEEALRNMQADLMRVARLTTMGELAASIAHEINQPLAGIVTSSNACLRWLAQDRPQLDAARRAAERVVSDGHRAGDIIRSVRALARKSGPEMAHLDINDTIREVLILVRSELNRHDVSLQTELSGGLDPIMGDRVQLQQVILNLIMNGVEAMSTLKQQPHVLRVRSQSEGLGNVLIAVEDSGPGLAPEAVDRLFEAFFSTKPNGMGMGLSICRSIIEAHGGELWVNANLPQGAIFHFTVPTQLGSAS